MWQGYFNALPGKALQTGCFLREYFFPFGCSVCGADLADPEEAWYGLCGECHAGIDRDLSESRTGKTCDFCGRPLISEHDRCLSCRNGEEHIFDKVTVFFPYTGKYRKLLAAYKFDKNLALGNFFIGKIKDEIEYGSILQEAGIVQGTSIVPVPPRPGKIREAGWDQVEFLARLLERETKNTGSLSVSRCLKRLPSQSQKELGLKNRRTNLKGRIVPVRKVPKTAIVIDDVMTTGSTLDACAAALKESGTEKVYCLCLFYD